MMLPLRLVLRGINGLFFMHPLVRTLGNVKIGTFSEIGPFVFLNAGKLGIIIGKFAQINPNVSIIGSVKIDDRVLIAPGVVIASGGHIISRDTSPRFSGSEDRGVLEIGSDCWIGANATIIGVIKIGSGSVIGAGTFVNQDIPPGSIVKQQERNLSIKPIH
jgi:acetyltransferase-like isoleucine patch superfamily enzyme